MKLNKLEIKWIVLMPIIAIIVFSSCSFLVKNLYLENNNTNAQDQDWIYSKKHPIFFSTTLSSYSKSITYHIDFTHFKYGIGDDSISGAIGVDGEHLKSFGPPLLPIIPSFLFNWIPNYNSDFVVRFCVTGGGQNIRTINKIICYNNKGDTLKFIKERTGITVFRINLADLDSLSNLYVSGNCYVGYIKGKKSRLKIKELIMEISCFDENDEVIILPPIKLQIYTKLRYVPIVLGS